MLFFIYSTEFREEPKIYDEMIRIFYNLISNKNEDLINMLCNYDLRKSLNVLRMLLSNSRWLEKDRSSHGAFKLNASNYKPYMVDVLRALGYGNGEIYINDDEQLIPNFFPNAEHGNKLIIIQILCFFKKNTHSDLGLSDKLLNIDNFIQRYSIICEDENYKTIINDTIKYLIKKGLLLPSPDECNQNEYTLAPRGIIILQLLKSNSILMEMFRDDIYLDSSFYNDTPSLNMDRARLFKEIALLATSLIQKEYDSLKLLRDANLLHNYKELFGRQPVMNHIFNGITKSFDAYFSTDAHKMPKVEFKKMKKSYKNLEELYNG